MKPRLPAWRRRPVDLESCRGSDFHPRIAIRRVQPAAAEVKGQAVAHDRVRASAQASAGLEDEVAHACATKVPPGRDARGAAPDNRDVDFGH